MKEEKKYDKKQFFGIPLIIQTKTIGYNLCRHKGRHLARRKKKGKSSLNLENRQRGNQIMQHRHTVRNESQKKSRNSWESYMSGETRHDTTPAKSHVERYAREHRHVEFVELITHAEVWFLLHQACLRQRYHSRLLRP